MMRVHQSIETVAVAAQAGEVNMSRDLLGLLMLVVLIIVELLLGGGSVGG